MAKREFRARWGVTLAAFAAVAMACGSADKSEFGSGANGRSGSSVGGTGSSGTLGSSGALGTGGSLGSGGASSAGGSASGGGIATDPRCTGGATTTISGTIYDPAILDPLYNITVFVPDPTSPLPTLARTGATCAACADFYPKSVNAVAVTDANGNFKISMSAGGQPVLAGKNIPLVVQTGKWRMQYNLANVATCVDNPQADKSLHLPTNSAEGDLPDIAISTGSADSLECLPLRIGVDPAEYTAGASTTGHIHVYQGAGGATTTPAAPISSQALWDSTADFQRNDVVLLSCEGQETVNMTAASQQSLSDYASAGGRVFASHFHYAWFNTGPFATQNLATWTPGSNHINDKMAFPGNVITTLNVGGGAFPEGTALNAWLGAVGALTNGQLPIWFARGNAVVSAANTPSQPWITFDGTVPAPGANGTQYFSFDTPIGASGSAKCGRVVYSDLHVSGGPGANEPGVLADYPAKPYVAPAGCANHPLTPQEKALEFMLFDLSSCLQPVGMAPPIIIQPPPR
jgi:hypothetical protein